MNDTKNEQDNRKNDSPGVASEKSRKGPIAFGICVLVLVALALAAFGLPWIGKRINYVGTDDAALQCDSVGVSATVTGRLAELIAAEGDRVKAGQVLALLEDSGLRAQKAQAATALMAARRQVELARINLEAARKDEDRTRLLLGSGAASEEQGEHASDALGSAQAQYAIALAQADDAAAKSGVVESELADCTIRSPLNGVVSQKNLSRGDVVQPGQVIYTINDLDELWVVAKFEETKLARIRVGAPVEVRVDAYAGAGTIEGTVALIGAGIVDPLFAVGDFTKTTQRVPVRIRLNASHAGLVPGLSAEVEVKTEALIRLPFGLPGQDR